MSVPDATAPAPRSIRRTLLDPRLITAAILIGGFFLLAFSAYIQDIGWFLWGAEVALTDGKLYRDFVEMNAPMIMVLNMIPEAVTLSTGISDMITYDLFTVLVLVLSLWLARRIYRETELAGDGPPWAWVLPALLIGYVVVAVSIKSWGQREHLTGMLVLPYLALALERVHGRVPSKALVIAAAVLCTIGIGIKPHFVFPLAAIEAFVAFGIGIRRAVFRLETVIVAVGLVAYLVLSMLIWPEYFRIMRDMGGADAYGGFLQSRMRAPSHFGTSLAVLTILISLAVPARERFRTLRKLLMWVVAGFLLAALSQQKGFDYHFIATLTFATALLMLTLADSTSRHTLARIAAGICLFVIVAKVGSRTLRTLRMVASGQGNHISSTIDIIDAYAPRGTVMGVSLGLSPFIPATTYTDAKWGSAFSTVWPLIRSYSDQSTSDAPIRYHKPAEMDPLERYMYDRMISDMVKNPPDLIVFRRLLTDELYGDGRFNYLEYFSQDERFRKLFSEYRLLPIDEHYAWYARGALADKPFTPPKPRRFGTRWSSNCYICLD